MVHLIWDESLVGIITSDDRVLAFQREQQTLTPVKETAAAATHRRDMCCVKRVAHQSASFLVPTRALQEESVNKKTVLGPAQRREQHEWPRGARTSEKAQTSEVYCKC